MNPLKLFIPSYLFDPIPGGSFMYFWPLLVLFVLIFLGSWKLKTLIKADALHHLPGRVREFALLGLLLTFFRNENIPYLGMRFFLVLFFLSMIAYGIWTYKNYRKSLSVRIVEKECNLCKDKYLPTAKKKKKKKRK
jgi:hypothetical protein